MNGMMSAEEAVMSAPTTNGMNGKVDGESEAMDVPSRPEEKRRLNWDGGLYLAPLTTVGNLVCLIPHNRPQLKSPVRSLSDGYACRMVPPSPAPRWLSPNRSFRATRQNGPWCAGMIPRRCLACNLLEDMRIRWSPRLKW